MSTFAYLRISLSRQDLEGQRQALQDYARRHHFQIDQRVEVLCSSRRDPQDRGLPQLLERLQPGDRLLVSELSRLGRSVGQILQIVEDLIRKEIEFVSLKEDLHLHGPEGLESKALVTLFSLFAEMEGKLISQRTKEGLAAARAQGQVLGRPKGRVGKSKLDGREEEIQRLLGQEGSHSARARQLGVSRTALSHFIRTRGLG